MFSEMKRSSFGPALVRLVTKFCLPEVLAMETITHPLFFPMADISAESQAIVLKHFSLSLVLLIRSYLPILKQDG